MLKAGSQDDLERQFVKQEALWVRKFLFAMRDKALRSQLPSLGAPGPVWAPLYEPVEPRFPAKENHVKHPQALPSGENIFTAEGYAPLEFESQRESESHPESKSQKASIST